MFRTLKFEIWNFLRISYFVLRVFLTKTRKIAHGDLVSDARPLMQPTLDSGHPRPGILQLGGLVGCGLSLEPLLQVRAKDSENSTGSPSSIANVTIDVNNQSPWASNTAYKTHYGTALIIDEQGWHRHPGMRTLILSVFCTTRPRGVRSTPRFRGAVPRCIGDDLRDRRTFDGD